MATLDYLTPEELRYIAEAPSSLQNDILESSKIKQHAAEIQFYRGLTSSLQSRYLEAKRKILALVDDETRYPEYLLDLSNCQLVQLPPETHLLPRRAKYFYLDVSHNRFDSYFVIRSAITHGKANHPIPFDAINLEGNPLRDIPGEVIERGKFATEHIEKYWMKNWAKSYTLASRITEVVREHRFTEAETARLMELLKESLTNSRNVLQANFAEQPTSHEPTSLAN